MLKKIFNKVDRFIQWTKKWHFFHIIVGGNAIGCAIIWILITLIEISNMKTFSIGDFLFSLIFITPLFVSGFLLFIALPIAIVISLYNCIFKKNIEITNNFLLNNSKYNIIYYISLIYIIFTYSLCILSVGFVELLFMEIFLLILEYILLTPIYIILIKKIKNKSSL